MVTIQEMCEVGDLGGLRTALGVPEAAQGSGWGTTALLDLAAGNKLHPEANDRHQNGTKTEHTLVEIAATHGQLGRCFPVCYHRRVVILHSMCG